MWHTPPGTRCAPQCPPGTSWSASGRARIFPQGADGFAADYDTLMRVAELLCEHVPSVESIGGYVRIDNIYDKTEDQLRELANVGYENPYIGVESGDDAVLRRINKGYTAAQAREVLEKIDAAGMPYIVNFLGCAGGHGYGLTNAQLTARLYDGLHPSMVNASMLTLVPGTPLYRAMELGRYDLFNPRSLALSLAASRKRDQGRQQAPIA